jgi:hypothetical protein
MLLLLFLLLLLLLLLRHAGKLLRWTDGRRKLDSIRWRRYGGNLFVCLFACLFVWASSFVPSFFIFVVIVTVIVEPSAKVKPAGYS